MRKSDLSRQQLAKRSRFVDTMRRAGWNLSGWEYLFDADADLSPEAQAEYDNGKLLARVGLSLTQNFVSWECTGLGVDFVLNARLSSEEDFQMVLDVICEHQAELDAAGVYNLLRALQARGTRILVETDHGYIPFT